MESYQTRRGVIEVDPKAGKRLGAGGWVIKVEVVVVVVADDQ